MKGQILYDSTHVKYLRSQKLQRQEVELCLPGLGEGEMGVSVCWYSLSDCNMNIIMEMNGDDCTTLCIESCGMVHPVVVSCTSCVFLWYGVYILKAQ